MDTLDVLRLAEEKGGEARRQAIWHVLRKARDLGCTYNPGGGKVGGFNVRYGNLGYSVLDVNTDGSIFLHVNPDNSITLSDEERASINEWIEGLEGLTVKNGPIQNYGQLSEAVEEIPPTSLDTFLEGTVGRIRERFYALA